MRYLSVSIYAVLFDKDDSFLGIAQEVFSPISSPLMSPFSFSGFGLYTMPEEVDGIDYYTIYVGAAFKSSI